MDMQILHKKDIASVINNRLLKSPGQRNMAAQAGLN